MDFHGSSAGSASPICKSSIEILSGDFIKAIRPSRGGPAAVAGVQQGDTILAIEGTDTAKLVLPDVRENIRRGPVGKKMTLLLDSAGKRHSVVFKLRDLV